MSDFDFVICPVVLHLKSQTFSIFLVRFTGQIPLVTLLTQVFKFRAFRLLVDSLLRLMISMFLLADYSLLLLVIVCWTILDLV